MVMNEMEIEMAVEVLREHAPEYLPYARFLDGWKEQVNDNSDGWAYYAGGRRAADKLSTLVKQALDALRDRSIEPPAIEDLDKALRPIRAAATRLGWEPPEFDEAAAAPGLR